MSHNNDSSDSHGGEVYQNKNISDQGPLEPRITDGPHGNLKQVVPNHDLGTSTTRTKTVKPSTVLVCSECQVYYEFDVDWHVCPQCGEDLAEVDRA